MEIVIIWLLFGFVSAMVASSRGASGCGYFFIGSMLGPFGLILAFVAKGKGAPESRPSGPSAAAEIEKLEGLWKRGAISRSEFEREKNRLLNH